MLFSNALRLHFGSKVHLANNRLKYPIINICITRRVLLPRNTFRKYTTYHLLYFFFLTTYLSEIWKCLTGTIYIQTKNQKINYKIGQKLHLSLLEGGISTL